MLDLVVAKQLRAMTLAATLQVGPGVVLLIGPSGAGKTTLLRMIAGLVEPDSGHILIDGRLQTDCARGVHRPPGQRGVGVVFQDYALFPHLSVEANVAYGLRARRVKRSERRRRTMAMLEQLGLAGLERERPTRLSGGQRQRVALARVLVLQPRVLLLDEPLAALDVQTRAVVRAELRRVLQGLAIPTLLVTHDPADLRVFGERIVVLESGKIVQDDAYADLEKRPATAFVGHVMDVNYYRGMLSQIGDGAGPRVRLDDDIVFQPVSTALPDGPVAVTIPPWEIRLRPNLDGAEGDVGVIGRVMQVEPSGGRVRVSLSLGAAGRLGLVVETPSSDLVGLSVVEGMMLAAVMPLSAIGVTPVRADM